MPVSSIEDLARQAAQLHDAVDWWNGWVVRSLIVAAVAAVAIGYGRATTQRTSRLYPPLGINSAGRHGRTRRFRPCAKTNRAVVRSEPTGARIPAHTAAPTA
jgi:hypothetical protein